MGWFSSSAAPEGDNARWSTAVHEAAHVVAVRKAGGRATATVAAHGRTGSYDGSMPDSDTEGWTDAVVHLAGGAGQRVLVGRDGPSGGDLSSAARSLRGTGLSRGHAEREARALVRRHRSEIERLAARLYRTGRV